MDTPGAARSRKRLTILSILLALVVALVVFAPDPQGSFPVTLESITTNELGQAEYLFRVENRAWDCNVRGASVRTWRGDDVWEPEDHLPPLDVRYTLIPHGEATVFRIIAPTNLWRVRFGFHRTNIPKWRQRVQSTGYSLFGDLPRFARIQHFMAADTVDIDPASPPTPNAGFRVDSAGKPTPIIVLRTGAEWRTIHDRSKGARWPR